MKRKLLAIFFLMSIGSVSGHALAADVQCPEMPKTADIQEAIKGDAELQGLARGLVSAQAGLDVQLSEKQIIDKLPHADQLLARMSHYTTICQLVTLNRNLDKIKMIEQLSKYYVLIFSPSCVRDDIEDAEKYIKASIRSTTTAGTLINQIGSSGVDSTPINLFRSRIENAQKPIEDLKTELNSASQALALAMRGLEANIECGRDRIGR